MFKIHEDTPIDMEQHARIDWPFKSLTVGQTVEIEEKYSQLFKKARVAAHALAASNGWKFSTRIGDNGSLFVQRIK